MIEIPMIEFRMLGAIRLVAADDSDLDNILRQPKRLAVLAYLSAPAPGTRHRRDLLLALFWPDLDTAHARTSLRNALYVLRQCLGDDVIHSMGDEEISVNPELLRTDLAAVLAALHEGRVDDALAAYGGELLPGLFPADSDGFQRWLDSERTRLKVAVSSAAVGRLNELESKERFTQALEIARRVLEIQPDDETLVRRVMTLHQALGDTAGALRAYEKFRARLAADFDAEPASATTGLAARLRSSPRPRPAVSAASVLTKDEPAESDAIAPAPSIVARPRERRRRARWAVALAAVVAGIGATAFVGWASSRRSMPQTLGTSAPLTAEEGLQVEAAISPNGRLVAYAKGDAAHLRIFVQKIGGGPAWALSGDSLAQELLPRWSPDNDQLLFLSRNDAYVAPSIGGSPRLVARGSSGNGMVRSASWAPHGDSVAIVRNDSLLVQPLEGTHTRLVGRGNQLHSCVWSPDGRWIACASGNWIEFEPGPLFGNDAPSSIELFPASGGPAIALTNADFQHRSPAWSADGKFLWMLSNRDGSVGEVYAIPIGKDGHAAGPVVRIGLMAEWIGLAANRIAYSVPHRRANIWTVPVPRYKPASMAAATPLTSGNQLVETVSTSRDGKWLVYDSNLRGNADIYRVPTSGGPAERLTHDERPEFAAALSPDDSELAWHRWVDGVRRVFVGKLDADSAREILPEPGDQGVPRWSPDGSSLAVWSHATAEGDVFVAKRDASGQWKESWRVKDAQLPVWSPDGKTIAFPRYDGSIQTIPADSGTRTTVYAPRQGTDDPIAVFLAWSTSPDTLWFLAPGASGRGGIWSLSLSTGAKRLLVRLDDPSRLIGPTLATDQRRFYFTRDERFSNISWAELVRR
jgi:Tol biopolymer transport system component/DNA-binding SARP family transcriptional activator